jgi:hypothetical protein
MSGMTSILGPENQIEILRGASKIYELEVLDGEGNAVDLTGARVILTVKCKLEDVDSIIQKDSDVGATQIDITHPLEGKAEIKFVPSDTNTMNTGEYIFDVWVVLTSGVSNAVINPSPFIVKAGVTVLT